LAIGIFSTKSEPSAVNNSPANQSQKEPGDTSDGFFSLALMAIIAVIIYNLLNRGGRTAAAQPAPPKAPPTPTVKGANAPATLPAPPAVEKEAEPVALPTPALLPGLLGLGLKLMRQKKVYSQTASGVEVP